jgi:predicted nucleic acid-binding protein
VIVLGKIGPLSLLPKLAGSVVGATGVADELAAGPAIDPTRPRIAGPDKDRFRAAESVDPSVASWDLGRGKSHVLTRALRDLGSEVLVDDLAAQKSAAALSIPMRGTAGFLPRAKEGRQFG